MHGILAVLLLAVPLAELWFILEVADRIGVVETVLSLIVVGVLGTWLLVREGRATWERLRAAIGRGEIPTTELAEGAAILVGGALLLTPGFLTDIAGLLLVVPITRVPATRLLRRALTMWFAGRAGATSRTRRVVYEASARNVRRKEASSDPEARRLPSPEGRRAVAGDSPDKG